MPVDIYLMDGVGPTMTKIQDNLHELKKKVESLEGHSLSGLSSSETDDLADKIVSKMPRPQVNEIKKKEDDQDSASALLNAAKEGVRKEVSQMVQSFGSVKTRLDTAISSIENLTKKFDEYVKTNQIVAVSRIKRYLHLVLPAVTALAAFLLSITAEGDMLAALGLRYGTDEATEFAEKVQRTLALAAYRSSVEMAKERGAFEIFDWKREQKNPFILRIKEADPELYADMKKYGRRNIACLTIAPTGTVSLMTQTTSGLEPVFMPVYKRRRKVNREDENANITFVDENGDAFEEFIVFHHKFVEWMIANGINPAQKFTPEEVDELVAKSPYYKATAQDVDWVNKVKMQGAMQKWVDHSISVTINLPNDVSEDLVNQLYVEAWKSGCKGCTVYRDGSRDGVLVDAKSDKKADKEKKDGKEPTLAPCDCEPRQVVEVRPRILEADVVRFQNNKEKWVAFVGILDGRPYEIFTGLQDDDEGIVLPKTVEKGWIIKNIDEDGKKRYDFQFTNKRGYKVTIEGLSEKFDKEYWNYAKLISGVLRYQMPIDLCIKLIGSLDLGSENINNWKNGVERALKKYVQDGTAVKGEKCSVCGSESLVYQEGCLICKNCGSSRCG